MTKNLLQKFDYEFDVKEEMDGQIFPNGKKKVDEDHMYMKVSSSGIVGIRFVEINLIAAVSILF